MFVKNFRFIFVLGFIVSLFACTKDKSPTVGVTNMVDLTTNPVFSIGSDSAICGGLISSDGGDLITERGICWATSTYPIVSQNYIKNGSGKGTFTSILKPLMPNTTYYVRVYIKNRQGTIYGNQLSFKTKVNLPIIQTTPATYVTQTGATTGGSIINDFGIAVTQKGICWSSTKTSPDLSDNVVSLGFGTSSFSIRLENLFTNTVYYARAFATNAVGTSYGNSIQFRTLSFVTPTITTNTITSIGRNSVITGGNVIDDGGMPVYQKGICWSVFQNPTVSNTRTNNGSGIGFFSTTITGLLPGTTYYVRAYATNSLGTSYGAQRSFRTLL